MEITGSSVGGVASGAPAAGSESIEKLVDGLVAFAESNPSAAAVQQKLIAISTTPLTQEIIGIMQKLGTLMAGATTPQQQLAIFDAATKALGAVRTDIANGRDFKLAMTLMGSKNDRTGALLASAIGSPVELKLAWAVFVMSAIAARAVIANGKV